MSTWISVPPSSLMGYLALIAIICIITVFSQIVIGTIFSLLKGKEYPQTILQQKLEANIQKHFLWGVVGILVVVVAEEICFRLIPAVVVVALELSTEWQIAAALASAALFGFLHGKSWCLRLQTGLAGLGYSILFLKMGGATQEFFLPLLIICIVHGGWNLVLFFLRKWALKKRRQMNA
jgi:hypothetical protein